MDDHEVHLWWATVDDLDVEAASSFITDEERARHLRFHFERSRLEFLATRALERTTLSHYAPIHPADWRFAANPHGRPEIVGPSRPHLHYNLANSHGLVACAVASANLEVGVDVESAARSESVGVADRYFAASEVAALRALPPEAQPRRFLDYWTLKESYIKARGLGLAIPLGHFAFSLEAPIRIAFEPMLPDDPAWWQFWQVEPTSGYLAAVAVRRPPGTRVDLVVRRASLAVA
jgi:4'-phosphopantetheinyl transferase